MPKFTLASPVSPHPVDGLNIVEVTRFSDKTKTMDLLVSCLAGPDEHPTRFVLTITNNYADVLLVNPHPTFQDVFVKDRMNAVDNPEIAGAFDQILGAFFATGDSDAILPAMASLGLVPAGASA